MAGSTKNTLGKGTILGYSVASGAAPYTYTPITKVAKVSPNLSVGEVEDTTLDSTWESYLPTLPSGECGFTVRHRPGDAAYKLIQTWVLTPTIVHFQVLFPDGSSIAFDGFVKGYSTTFENKSIVDAEVPLRITAQPTFTEPA